MQPEALTKASEFLVSKVKKTKIIFICGECGYQSAKWLGRCPVCEKWNTFLEEVQLGTSQVRGNKAPLLTLAEIEGPEEKRISTKIKELDRVLGGGVVPGSVILVGGDPGIGKSTLLLQVAAAIAEKLPVLYVTGEESPEQLKRRSQRLGLHPETLAVLAETNFCNIAASADSFSPRVMIIDSIQTIYKEELGTVPGSVSQVREVTASLIQLAKNKGISIFVVGHVTKEGVIAGPRMLEHMVDCVLYFEGERYHNYRVLRSVKNRFGSTYEMGIFTMGARGLAEVENPSAFFLSQYSESVPGSVIVATMEGSRSLLVELQALVTSSGYASPRRTVTGFDQNRVALMIAVLEKRVGLNLQDQDVFVNLVGGMRITEPALDLGLAVALASSYREQPLSKSDIVFGEVGLTGEVRAVSRAEMRLSEAVKLGFSRCILPLHNVGQLSDQIKKELEIELIGVKSLPEALDALF